MPGNLPNRFARRHPDATAPRWATGPEVCDYLQVTLRTVRLWAAQGLITGHRFGPRLIRYDLNEIDAMSIPTGDQ